MTSRTSRCVRDVIHRSNTFARAGGVPRPRRLDGEAVGVRVHREEGVGARERPEEPVARLDEVGLVEADRLPDRAGGQQEPAHDVGAVLRHQGHGVDHVPLGLRHLLALGVEHHVVGHARAVGGRAAVHRADGQERVEPAARLVDALGDDVGGVRARDALDAAGREGVVPLREGHRAGVEPAVHDLGRAAHRAPAAGLRAGPRQLVDVGAVEVERVGEPARRLLQRVDKAGYLARREKHEIVVAMNPANVRKGPG